MSGVNTKASKVDRILSRQAEMDKYFRGFHECLLGSLRMTHEVDTSTIKMLTETAHRLEAENQRLRKYLGKLIVERREAREDPLERFRRQFAFLYPELKNVAR